MSHKPTDHSLRKRGGFTLIEMLVVIAIMALLSALLFPLGTNLLEKSRTMKCASNLREMGSASLMYAEDYQGRFPGGGTRTVPTTSSLMWYNILYQEGYLKYPVQRHGDVPRKNQIYCPSMKPYPPGGTRYPRAYRINVVATGGVTTSSNPSGSTGLLLTPSEFPRAWDGQGLTYYRLGSKVQLSPRPSAMVLIQESEVSNDFYQYRTTNSGPDGLPRMNDNPTFPPWSGSSGNFAYRHQDQQNILFWDGHVRRLKTTDPINLSYMWLLNP